MIDFLPARLVSAAILGLSLFMVACSPQEKAPPPDPAILLQSVPPADSSKYKLVKDMRNWRNPYLILHYDGVALLDPADSAEIQLKPEEMLPALARLPASAWPYGRVVALAESGPKATEQGKVALRRNKGIIGGILERAKISINWVPPT